MTAAQVASQRPKVPILAITSFETVARRLCLSWEQHAQLPIEFTNSRQQLLMLLKPLRS